MKNYVWKSSMAPLISQYLEIKHLSGLKYEQQERCLQHFDHYFYYNGYEGDALTKEILFPFIYEQDEAESTIRNKENLFADFAKYISDRGHYAYMFVPQYEFRRSHYIPHIYTREETKRFLHAVDTYPAINSPDRNTIDPVLFRVIIGTGCRLSEALNLRISDYDRELGTIRVMHSKNDRSRIIPVSISLNKRISGYVDAFHSQSDADAILFPGRDGKMNKSTAYIHFRDYLFMADIPHTASGPRIHDFRYPNQNKIQTFFTNLRQPRNSSEKRFGYIFQPFRSGRPQRALSEPSFFFHLRSTFVLFSPSRVASALASSSVVMSRYTMVV